MLVAVETLQAIGIDVNYNRPHTDVCANIPSSVLDAPNSSNRGRLSVPSYRLSFSSAMVVRPAPE